MVVRNKGIYVKLLVKGQAAMYSNNILIFEELYACIHSFGILNQDLYPVKDIFLLDL